MPTAYHLIDKEKMKMVEDILEKQYSYISDEVERKKKIQTALNKSEEEILRKLPLSVRNKFINMRSDPKAKFNEHGEWLNQTQAKVFVNSFKSEDAEVVKPMRDASKVTVMSHDIRFDKSGKEAQVVKRQLQW